MTNDELAKIRLLAQITAIEQLLITTSRALQAFDARYAESLRAMADQASELQMAIPEYAPEKSDLVSAEFQEALQRLLQRALQPPTS